MILVGCDLHARQQQVAALDTATGEIQECQLSHHGEAVERYYAALPPPVTVAVESTGYALWFHALIRQLGHTLAVGDATKIRAMVVRKTKTDRRDALTCSSCSATTGSRLSGFLTRPLAISAPSWGTACD